MGATTNQSFTPKEKQKLVKMSDKPKKKKKNKKQEKKILQCQTTT